MRAKTLLALLFIVSLGIAAVVLLRAMPQNLNLAATAAAKDEILVAALDLAPGTLLRAQDVTWQPRGGEAKPGEIIRPAADARAANPALDEQTRAEVYGAALRITAAADTPILRGAIVKPADRDFLRVVLKPGERAMAIPVATGGASTGLLFPGDQVDVILTQDFKDNDMPLARRSVSETILRQLRVLAIDAPDPKAVGSGSSFGRTVTLEVTPKEAQRLNVAIELGKLSLTLRSLTGAGGLAETATSNAADAAPVTAIWAGDVSPSLGTAEPPGKVVAAPPPVAVIHGATKSETVKGQ